jgi:hypothetical protein
LEESFRYQNTMSNGTTQERAAMMLELRDTERNRQQQIEASLRQVEQLRLQREEAQKLALAEEDKQTIENERKQKRGLSQGIG